MPKMYPWHILGCDTWFCMSICAQILDWNHLMLWEEVLRRVPRRVLRRRSEGFIASSMESWKPMVIGSTLSNPLMLREELLRRVPRRRSENLQKGFTASYMETGGEERALRQDFVLSVDEHSWVWSSMKCNLLITVPPQSGQTCNKLTCSDS